jgi:NhaA family Na+:H+ antiporter
VKTRSDLRPAAIRRLTAPIRRFLHVEAASGLILMICTAVALILANSPWGHAFHEFWETSLRVGIGPFEMNKSLHFWVNDALMTIFFFVVGLEIKREIVEGELQSRRKAALPVIGALGGMLIPAGVYLALQHDGRGARGWGIPMATDIAFVVGVMAAFGPRVPFGLKIFLLSLAIADDMGAVLVIAMAYTEHLNLLALGLGGAGLALTVSLNLLGVRPVGIYFLVGAATWLAILKSGIHPTIAGVALGLLTPTKAWLKPTVLSLIIRDVLRTDDQTDSPKLDLPEADLLSYAARESVSPLVRLEAMLHPWVGFVIMPIFALANAGVEIRGSSLMDPVAGSIGLALVLGKAVGIFGFCWIAVRCGLAQLPQGVNWVMMLAAGVLGGIGFTMSLFVAGLAFSSPPDLVDASKSGILLGSFVSAGVGALLLWRSLPRNGSPSSHSETTPN